MVKMTMPQNCPVSCLDPAGHSMAEFMQQHDLQSQHSAFIHDWPASDANDDCIVCCTDDSDF
jgi:hypothetical protein